MIQYMCRADAKCINHRKGDLIAADRLFKWLSKLISHYYNKSKQQKALQTERIKLTKCERPRAE